MEDKEKHPFTVNVATSYEGGSIHSEGIVFAADAEGAMMRAREFVLSSKERPGNKITEVISVKGRGMLHAG